MAEPIDETYFVWLYDLVGNSGRRSSRTHWDLLRQLHTKEFFDLVPNDDNRVEDGRELRYEFVQEFGLSRIHADWMGIGCSVLEMLIGLSRRLAFQAEGDYREWFWQLIQNLELSTFNDAHYDRYQIEIEEKLNCLIHRTYASNGKGGLFPLNHPAEDQTRVEIWYQLEAYILEQN